MVVRSRSDPAGSKGDRLHLRAMPAGARFGLPTAGDRLIRARNRRLPGAGACSPAASSTIWFTSGCAGCRCCSWRRPARFGLDAALAAGAVPDGLRMWLVLATYILLTIMLLANRGLPGLTAAALGTAANGIAIVANGGWMPVWQPSLAAAGFDPNASIRTSTACWSGRSTPASSPTAGPLSTSSRSRSRSFNRSRRSATLLLGAGLAFFVFAALVRAPVVWSRCRSRRHRAARLAGGARPKARSAIRTFDWRPMARSRRCGSARSSARSATASTRSRWSSWWPAPPTTRRWRSASSSPR
jgi:hypothetical protein